MTISIAHRYSDLTERLFAAWNDQTPDVLRQHFSENISLKSSRLGPDNPLCGVEAVVAAIMKSRRASGPRELVHVLVDDDRLVLLLLGAQGLVTWNLRLNADDRVCEIVTAHGSGAFDSPRPAQAASGACALY